MELTRRDVLQALAAQAVVWTAPTAMVVGADTARATTVSPPPGPPGSPPGPPPPSPPPPDVEVLPSEDPRAPASPPPPVTSPGGAPAQQGRGRPVARQHTEVRGSAATRRGALASTGLDTVVLGAAGVAVTAVGAGAVRASRARDAAGEAPEGEVAGAPPASAEPPGGGRGAR